MRATICIFIPFYLSSYVNDQTFVLETELSSLTIDEDAIFVGGDMSDFSSYFDLTSLIVNISHYLKLDHVLINSLVAVVATKKKNDPLLN